MAPFTNLEPRLTKPDATLHAALCLPLHSLWVNFLFLHQEHGTHAVTRLFLVPPSREATKGGNYDLKSQGEGIMTGSHSDFVPETRRFNSALRLEWTNPAVWGSRNVNAVWTVCS